MRPAGFNKDGETIVAKRLHQRQGIFLEQRFPTGQFDERQPEIAGCRVPIGDLKRLRQLRNLCTHPGQSFFLSFGKGICGVAIRAAQIARRKTDENAWQPGEGAFALQAQIDFVDDEGAAHASNLAEPAENGTHFARLGWLLRAKWIILCPTIQ
jgi:hypothetical protein